jgi:tetratricopeptide (TPR) repeat protein
LLYTQGKYDEAEPLYRQSLAIDRKVSVLMSVCLFHRTSCQVYGDEHPNVATDLYNLEELLRAQGKHDEAEPLYRQSLEISRKVLGEEHSDVVGLLNNLAQLLYTQGKYDEAEPLYRQSLAIDRKVYAIHLAASSCDNSCKILSEEHPAVATSLNNLAVLLYAQGKHNEALICANQSLDIRRRKLGDEHPDARNSARLVAHIEAAAKPWCVLS